MFQLILKSLWHFRKQHLSVFAGTIISTAVLTGALIIGDSVRFSLQNLVHKRLGKTESILNTGGRFVRSDLAHEIAASLHTSVAPILLLRGVAINSETKNKINSVQVIGIDDDFRSFSENLMPALNHDEALISENVAQLLNLKIGDELLLRVENTNTIPLNTPLVRENKPSVALRLIVKAIVKENSFGRFSLKSNQSSPYNIFVSREYLADKLELKGMSNMILFAGNQPSATLDSMLAHYAQLADFGLKLGELPEPGKYELVSNRIFIDKLLSGAIEALQAPHENILTYLVNSIRCNGKETPYSFVTAASSPLIPNELKKNEIIINEWLAKDLNAREGDSVSLSYYVIGTLRTLKEEIFRFVIKQIIPTEGGLADRNLMPSFPGLSDAGNCRDWNTGAPIDLKKIRDKDEKYWDDFRGTPKAFIPLETGMKLWGNPFGNLTAIRFNKKDFLSEDSLKKILLKNINLKSIGISVVSVRNEGLSAASNSVDFGELFLSLSFFVIAAAVLLTMLVYSLNTTLRSQETAIFAALGFSKNRIMKFRFAESSLVILLGSLVGALAGIMYNELLIAGLNSVWHGAVRERMLEVHIQPFTLATGAISGIIIALTSIYFVTRKKLKQPIGELVKGSIGNLVRPNAGKFSEILAISGISGALCLVMVSIITSSYENAWLFLSSGALFLAGSTALVSCLISRHRQNTDNRDLNLLKLAFKNAGRNKSRSLTIILVLALGTFIVVLTGSYRKTFYGEENHRKSGSGGYSFWAETTLPLSFNLNTAEGRKNLVFDNDQDLNHVYFSQLHTLDGDDASCLNLNQVKRPQILGINAAEFNKRRAFSFVKLLDEANKEHPWTVLDKQSKDNVIPAIADQTVIHYGLKKKVGDTLTYDDEYGQTMHLCLVAGLDNSIFQGNVLISDSIFVKHFPSMGSRILLVDAPLSKQKLISEIINTSLSDFGVTVTPATVRLSEFNSIEDTYLSIFMALGGLGLLIGTFGLGIILFRNILERYHELALLTALGFRKKQIFQLVLIENVFLLISGLLCGSVAALIGVFPSIISPSFRIQGEFLIILISVVLIIGVLWIYLLSRRALKGNIITVLQME